MLEIRSTPSATEDKLDDPPHRRFFLWLFFLLFFFVCVKRRNWNEIEQFQQLLPTANPRRCSEQIRNSSVSLADLDFVFFFARIFFFKENSETPTLRLQWRISMERSATTAIDSKELFFGLFFFWNYPTGDWMLTDADWCWNSGRRAETATATTIGRTIRTSTRKTIPAKLWVAFLFLFFLPSFTGFFARLHRVFPGFT